MATVGRLRYLDVPARGAGRSRGTLVLIHAFPLHAGMWEPQFALADRGWRIVAPDLRGLGEGAGDPPTTSMDDFAGDVIDLLDALHVETAVIGGLSLGGYVTFAVLRHAPAYFRGIVLADTRPQADPPDAIEGRKKMQALAREKGPGAVADQMLPKLLGETTHTTQPAVVERVKGLIMSNSPAGISGALAAMMTRQESESLLGSIRCPALVIVGEEDALTPPALSEDMHRKIPGSILAKIPQAGHLANLEQPSRFNDALGQFLEHRI
jgi:pimeloyl-ACP methyl ester carboxylesterase